MRSGFLLAVLLLPSLLTGCYGEDLENASTDVAEDSYPEPWDRTGLTYDDTDIYSRVSVNGTYETAPVQSVYVPVPSITLADGGAGAAGGAEVHLGLWLPVIEGCDYSSTENLSTECLVPVIAEIGLTPQLIEQLKICCDFLAFREEIWDADNPSKVLAHFFNEN